jgi:fructoselysine transporter
VINAILAMRVIIQFIGQGVGVMLLRRRWPSKRIPFKMWLYPLPAVLSIASWIWIFVSTGLKFALGGLTVTVLGIVTYMIQARYRRLWPFDSAAEVAGEGQR